MSEKKVLVRIRGLAKDYKRGVETVHVLEKLDLDIREGDFLALMGPSGSGKSTLLNLIGGLDRPSSGTLEVAGQRVDSMGDGALARWRANNVGFIFQMYNLLPVLSAERNVELPLLLTRLSRSERRKRVEAALSLLQALNQRHGKTIVMVTHDPHAAARASHTLHLTKGQLAREPEAA